MVPGWRRPVRDDVTDTSPHGDVTLERGLVQSCNAYFAQLGARLGGGPLRDTAALFDIQLTRGNAAERLRDTLPFAAYGQGEVLATPYRMARVAASIAADGVLPPGRTFLDDGQPAGAPVRVLDTRRGAAVGRGDARGRDVGHRTRPAGAPGAGRRQDRHGRGRRRAVAFVVRRLRAVRRPEASRRIAFAVIIENGGYGGRAAAPLAGEIVTAARDLGVLGPSAAPPQ